MLLIWSFFGPLLFSLKTTLPVGAQRCVALVTRLCAPKGGTQDLVCFFFLESEDSAAEESVRGHDPHRTAFVPLKVEHRPGPDFFFFLAAEVSGRGHDPHGPYFFSQAFVFFSFSDPISHLF